MRDPLDLAQRVAFMAHGYIVFEGTPLELQHAESVRAQWLGIQAQST